MRGDLDKANEILPTIPKEQLNKYVIRYRLILYRILSHAISYDVMLFSLCFTYMPSYLFSFHYIVFVYISYFVLELLPIVSVAHFLESRGMIEDALEIATDADYRFELAIQLGRLEIAKVNIICDD